MTKTVMVYNGTSW